MVNQQSVCHGLICPVFGLSGPSRSGKQAKMTLNGAGGGEICRLSYS
jgi:hypothetical protein